MRRLSLINVLSSPIFPLFLYTILLLAQLAVAHKLHWRSNQIEVFRSEVRGVDEAKPVGVDHALAQLHCIPCPNEQKGRLNFGKEGPIKRRSELPDETNRMHKHPMKICRNGISGLVSKKRHCCNPCTSTCCCPCCNCHWPCCGCSCQCGCCKKCCCCCCKPCCCCCNCCCCGGGGGRRRRRRHLERVLKDGQQYAERKVRQIEFGGGDGGGDGHWHGDEEKRRR